MFVKTQSGKLVNLAKFSQITAVAYTADRNLFRIEARGHSIDYVYLAEGLTQAQADDYTAALGRMLGAGDIERAVRDYADLSDMRAEEVSA